MITKTITAVAAISWLEAHFAGELFRFGPKRGSVLPGGKVLGARVMEGQVETQGVYST